MAKDLSSDERRLHVRLPAELYNELERRRFVRSQELGRRVSLRELVEETLISSLKEK